MKLTQSLVHAEIRCFYKIRGVYSFISFDRQTPNQRLFEGHPNVPLSFHF